MGQGLGAFLQSHSLAPDFYPPIGAKSIRPPSPTTPDGVSPAQQRRERQETLRRHFTLKYADFFEKPLLLKGLKAVPDTTHGKYVDTKNEVKSLNDASLLCDKAPRCRYFAWDSKRQSVTLMEGTRFDLDSDENVTSGEHYDRVLRADYRNPPLPEEATEVEKKFHAGLVKARDSLHLPPHPVDPGTLLFANAKTACHETLRVAPNVFEARDAAVLCKNTPKCTHWTMTTVASPWNYLSDDDDTRIFTKLCGGSDVELLPESGTVSAVRIVAPSITDSTTADDDPSRVGTTSMAGATSAANANAADANNPTSQLHPPQQEIDESADETAALANLGKESVPQYPVTRLSSGATKPPDNGPIGIPLLYKKLREVIGSSSSVTTRHTAQDPNDLDSLANKSACEKWPNACRDWVDFLYPKELKDKFPPGSGAPPPLSYMRVHNYKYNYSASLICTWMATTATQVLAQMQVLQDKSSATDSNAVWASGVWHGRSATGQRVDLGFCIPNEGRWEGE
ncbi:unnamed protein product, partial [Amoebophrya sp. A120]|eukprot:GSA120T00000274001.1